MAIWASNLTRYQDSVKRKGNNPLEQFSLAEKSKILFRVKVIGRYKYLGIEMKSKSERSYEIGKELKRLWQEKLNFNHISDTIIRSKLYTLLKMYEKCRKKKE